MQEYFLHFLWQYGLFDTRSAVTTCGQPIHFDFRGIHNPNSGPDISEARIRICPMDWIGQVEIHIHASDWLKHNHQTDKAYDNVILHVVLQVYQKLDTYPNQAHQYHPKNQKIKIHKGIDLYNFYQLCLYKSNKNYP